MKIFISQLNPIIGDLEGNTDKILKEIAKAKEEKADVVVFAELAICGYPPDDLLFFPDFQEEMHRQLNRIVEASENIFVVVGLVRPNNEKKGKSLFNSAAIICNKELLGYKDKTLLPTYSVFDEGRYFAEGGEQKVFEYKGKKIGVLICEDIWEHMNLPYAQYARDPVEEMNKLKPDILLVVTASPYYHEKMDLRLQIYRDCVKTLHCPLIATNQVGGNDQLIFDGYSCAMNEKGDVLYLAPPFKEDSFLLDLDKKLKPIKVQIDHLADLYNALVLGVKDYFTKLNLNKACLGLSGGIDSALTASIAVDALGKENIVAISMPSRFSSLSSMDDADELAKNLGIQLQHIPIDHIFQQFLDMLSPVFAGRKFDVTEENIQARIRGIILMAVSNKFGYIVLSTGNKSEMAMGYATLYGDMTGGLGILNDVAKTQVFELAKYVNREKEIIPKNIITKPPSAELRAEQKDEDELPSYNIVDVVLRDYVEDHLTPEDIIKRHKYPKHQVEDLIKRIHKAEYKRRQGPPGLRVSKTSFSKGRFFPIVQKWVSYQSL